MGLFGQQQEGNQAPHSVMRLETQRKSGGLFSEIQPQDCTCHVQGLINPHSCPDMNPGDLAEKQRINMETFIHSHK